MGDKRYTARWKVEPPHDAMYYFYHLRDAIELTNDLWVRGAQDIHPIYPEWLLNEYHLTEDELDNDQRRIMYDEFLYYMARAIRENKIPYMSYVGDPTEPLDIA